MTVLKIPTAGVECIRYFIGPQDLVVIDGIEHCWVSTDENGHVLNLRNEPERHVSFTHSHYYQLVRSNRCARHGGYFSEGKARARNAVKWVPISTLPEHVSRKTLTYGDALDIFIDMRNAYGCWTHSDNPHREVRSRSRGLPHPGERGRSIRRPLWIPVGCRPVAGKPVQVEDECPAGRSQNPACV